MFIPDSATSQDNVPFLEDAKGDGAKYYSTSKSITDCETDVRNAIALNGGFVVNFASGKFKSGDSVRFGYIIEFVIKGIPGRITIMGLPIRKETPSKIKQTRKMALLNVANSFQSAFMINRLVPGSNPLIMHMLVDGPTGEQVPIHEAIENRYQLSLPETSDIQEGEFKEIS